MCKQKEAREQRGVEEVVESAKKTAAGWDCLSETHYSTCYILKQFLKFAKKKLRHKKPFFLCQVINQQIPEVSGGVRRASRGQKGQED